MIPQPRDYANDEMDYQRIFRHWYSRRSWTEYMDGDGTSGGHPYRFGSDESVLSVFGSDKELEIVGLL